MNIELEIEAGLVRQFRSSHSTTLRIDGATVDLPGGSVISPGFVDSHCHLIGPGEMGDMADLVGTSSWREVVTRLEIWSPPESTDWITGFGWNEELWDEVPTSTEPLDRLFGDRPAMLLRIDTHAAWCNRAALRRAGLDPRPDQYASDVLLNAEGEPTGLILDAALKRLRAGIPPPDTTTIRRWYRTGIDYALRNGLTTIHDMTVRPEWFDVLQLMAEAGDLDVNVYVFLDGSDDRWQDVVEKFSGDSAGRSAGTLRIAGVKYFADGALGSRGAHLLEPYEDAPGVTGLQLIEPQALVDGARAAIDAGLAVATHAIGDAANRMVLDVYEQLRTEYSEAVLRIEHAQLVDTDDRRRFGELRLHAAVQPVHCTSDIEMAEKRLGRKRAHRIGYPWRSILDAGGTISGGSDFPIESGNPLRGLRAFVERSGRNGTPWTPHERLTPREALDAYTGGAGHGIPERQRPMPIHQGMSADFTLLSGNPFDVGTEVIGTIVGGRLRLIAE